MKLKVSFKYEKCEGCGFVLVPVTTEKVNGKRLCTACAGSEAAIERNAISTLQKYHAMKGAAQ